MKDKTEKDHNIEENWFAYAKRTSEECSRIVREVLDTSPGILYKFIKPSIKSVKKVV